VKYLGVDFGLKRIGLAISEGQLASPLKIIVVFSLNDALTKIKKEVKASNIDKIVVGLPEGETGKAAEKFINGLKREKLDVEAADETLSTQDTTQLLIEMGLSKKKRAETDAYAAAAILQNYLDSK
jgi:putative holliday junction resolvase